MRKIIFLLAGILTLVSILDVAAQTKPDALELYRQGKFSDAVDVCLAEITANPNSLESHVVLCWALVQAKRYQEADNWAQKGRAISNYDPRLIEIQAEAEYYLGLNDDSLKLFQDYISNTPNGSRIAPAYSFMGEIYLRQAKYRHADIAFSTAVQLDALNSPWWVRLGYAREKAADYRNSLDAYNKALQLDATLQDAVRGRDRVVKQLN